LGNLTILDHITESIDSDEVDTSNNLITVAASISTGTRIQFLNSVPPVGLSPFTFYYVVNADTDDAYKIQLATTLAHATADTPTVIDITGTGTEPHILEIYGGTNSRKLEYILEADFIEHVADITERTSGESSIYIDKGDIFELGRAPSEALCGELVYWKWQDALSGDNSEPEVSHIEDLICLGATIFGWRVLEEVEKKKDAIAELDKLLAGHMRVLARHPDEFLVDQGFRGANAPVRGNIAGYLRGRGYMYPGVK